MKSLQKVVKHRPGAPKAAPRERAIKGITHVVGKQWTPPWQGHSRPRKTKAIPTPINLQGKYTQDRNTGVIRRIV